MLLGTLAQAHELNGNYELAYEFYKQAVAAERSHFSESELKKLGRLESKLELIKQQNKIDLLEASNLQNEQQKFFMMVIASSILLALIYIVFNQRQKSELKEKLLHIEIAELKDKVLLSFTNPVVIPPLSSLNERLHHPISDREYEVLENIVSQKSNKEISDSLYISINTVKYHVKNLYIKLGVSNRKEVIEKIAIG